MAVMTASSSERPLVQPAASIPRSGRAFPRALAWILLAGAVVRVGLWLVCADMPVAVVDAQDYNRLAVGLVRHGAYLTPDGELSSLRPPLYPVVVAGVYRVFGLENHAAVRALQALLSLGTVVVVYRLGLLAFTERAGLWAATLVCFYPSLLGFNNLLLSETLFTFLVCLVTWLVGEAVVRGSLGWLAVAGVALGLGALTRSILWLFAPLLSVYLVVAWRGPAVRRLLAGAVPFVLFVATIAPWAYRNTQVQKTFTVIDVMGGRNAMMGNYEYTPLERSWATIDIARGEQSWDAVLRREYPKERGLTQGQIDKLAMRHGIRFVLAHPALTAKRTLVRFFNYWQLERSLIAGMQQGIFGSVPTAATLAAALLICGFYAAIMFLGIFGALMCPPGDRRLHWLVVMTIIFPCVIHSLIFAHSRYHLPAMPALLLYSAAALTRLPELWARRSEWTFRVAALLVALLVLGWARELIFVDLAKASHIIG
jgi:4-amino-4-deoxy-L-arabinose transferase-like glycosyltransferase